MDFLHMTTNILWFMFACAIVGILIMLTVDYWKKVHPKANYIQLQRFANVILDYYWNNETDRCIFCDNRISYEMYVLGIDETRHMHHKDCVVLEANKYKG